MSSTSTSSHLIFFGWNRSIPGRERMSAEHFQGFNEYLGALQRKGQIQAFEPVFLEVHGGSLNGFFLIRGDQAQLDVLSASSEWHQHMVRAALHLQEAGAVRGVCGDKLMERMAMWTQAIPAK